MSKYLAVRLALVISLLATQPCPAAERLFRIASRNYDARGSLGKAYRNELEPRMFAHAAWLQRLYCNPYEPDIDETLEIYAKPDGLRWLSYRRANPSISRYIGERYALGERFDLKEKLRAVHVEKKEIALPAEVATEIEVLWRAMLSRLSEEQKTNVHVLVMHAPAIIAFMREGDSVKTGRIATAAYDTPAYKAFITIVDDLTKACSRSAKLTDPAIVGLPHKIRALTAKLRHQDG
jgi:hypothetical protein